MEYYCYNYCVEASSNCFRRLAWPRAALIILSFFLFLARAFLCELSFARFVRVNNNDLNHACMLRMDRTATKSVCYSFINKDLVQGNKKQSVC